MKIYIYFKDGTTGTVENVRKLKKTSKGIEFENQAKPGSAWELHAWDFDEIKGYKAVGRLKKC